MTTQMIPSDSSPDLAVSAPLVSRSELETYLRPSAFPARQDDLLALLISRRAPSRLLWRVGQCSAMRTYPSLDALWQDLS